MSVIFLIVALLLFVGLIVAHEFGHFIMARRNGVEVEEFGIGFPPRAWAKQMKDFVFTLNWLPLGGFVKLKGEHDADKKPGSFGSASTGAKAKIMLAGVTINFLIAYILLTLISVVALPKAQLDQLPFYTKEQFTVTADERVVSSRVIIGVSPETPADEAGLKTNDELIRVGISPVGSADDLPEITKRYAGKTVPIVYVRDGQEKTTTAKLNKERGDEGYLGVVPATDETLRYTWSAPIVGAGLLAQYTEVSFRGIGYALSNLVKGDTQAAQDSVGGPVATVKLLSDSSGFGITQMPFIIALISPSLGIMNVLPIPALDGGRLFVMLLFRTLKKPLTPKLEEWIHGTGFAMLMLLFVLITVVDIKRIF